jgi:hypothetical protein
MIFTTREDIEAPIDFVFAQVSDFVALERMILRRGGEVQRRVDRVPAATGMVWDASFDMRGKLRQVEMTLVRFEPPAVMRFEAVSKALVGDLLVELVALSRARTRLALTGELKPQTLSARLMVQSLKLTRGNVSKRFEMRVASYAKDLEDKYTPHA